MQVQSLGRAMLRIHRKLARQPTKSVGEDRRDPGQIDHAIRQIVSRAISSNEVMDIFATAGLNKPDISVLSDEFLAEVRDLPHRNLAVEMLRKLLEGEIQRRTMVRSIGPQSAATAGDSTPNHARIAKESEGWGVHSPND